MHHTVRAVPLALLLLVATATAALGHASFQEREVPASAELTIVLRVPEERPGEGTVAVETLVPPAFEIVECPSEDGWTCTLEERDEGLVLVWVRDEGGEDAELPLTVRTPDSTGDHRWPTIQTYDSGNEIVWAQQAGEERPAPVLTIAASDSQVVESTEDPADHGTDVAESEAVAPDETVPPTEPTATEFTPPVSPSEEGAPDDPASTTTPVPTDAEDDAEGGMSAITLGVILVLLAAALGAVRVLRRGPAGGTPEGATRDEPYDPGV